VIRNIIFDWSGTLVDDLPAVLEATNHVLTQAGRPRMTVDEFRAEFCLPFTRFYDRHVPHVSLTDLEQWFHSRFTELQASVCALPHAERFLQFCRARQLRTFVLSTVTEAYYQTQARLTGFGDYIHTAYLGVRDKRRRINDILVEHRLHPEETLFIGDMEHDIETARHGGIHSCGVLTGYNTLEQLRNAKPDLIVEHLGELQDLLEQNEMRMHVPGGEWARRHRPIVTAGALIFNDQDEVLMVRTHKWSNRWGIPGGKIQWGEPSVAGLQREILEETGLAVTDIRFELVQDCIHSREFYRDAHFILLNYTCRVLGDIQVKLNDEAQAFQWVPLAGALGLDLNHPTRVLVDHVQARRQDHSIDEPARAVLL
jgi:phosphoglycolate phosphatase-like HAD superfamily hydrolase/ADP-ribose pyrophosphatase YjhB (NUDIX family)